MENKNEGLDGDRLLRLLGAKEYEISIWRERALKAEAEMNKKPLEKKDTDG